MPAPSISNDSLVTVEYKDGTKEKIRVNDDLLISELYEFIRHVGADNTPALVALCCGKPVDWIDKLKRPSFRALARKAIAANFQAAMEIVEDDPIAAAKLAPFLTAAATAAQSLTSLPPSTGTGISQPSPAKSPALAPSESAVATGSGSPTP